MGGGAIPRKQKKLPRLFMQRELLLHRVGEAHSSISVLMQIYQATRLSHPPPPIANNCCGISIVSIPD